MNSKGVYINFSNSNYELPELFKLDDFEEFLLKTELQKYQREQTIIHYEGCIKNSQSKFKHYAGEINADLEAHGEGHLTTENFSCKSNFFEGKMCSNNVVLHMHTGKKYQINVIDNCILSKRKINSLTEIYKV